MHPGQAKTLGGFTPWEQMELKDRPQRLILGWDTSEERSVQFLRVFPWV